MKKQRLDLPAGQPLHPVRAVGAPVTVNLFGNFMKRTMALALLTFLIVSFGASTSHAASGAGTMTVSPTTATAGATGNTFSFQFRTTTGAGGTYTAGSYATVIVPAGWTAPQSSTSGSAGYVSVTTAGTATASVTSISGTGPWTITITFTCNSGTGNGFNLSYAGGGTAVTAPTTAGINTFTTATRLTAGTPTVPLGTSPSITVGAAAASQLAFVQEPSDAAEATAIAPAMTVQILDQYGNLTASTATVTLAIGNNPSSGTLSGGSTANAVAGTATFTGRSINNSGVGYTLTASATGLTGDTSTTFNITGSRFSVASGNWSSTATWARTSGGAAGVPVPNAADTVTINAGVTVTVDTTATCASITFTAGAAGTATRVAISGANSLAVSGAVTINQQNTVAAGSANYLDVAAGTFSAGSVALTATTSGSRFTQLLISTGTATITGNITSAGTASQIVFSDVGTLNAGGTFLSGTAGTFTPSTGTVNYNAAGAQAIAPFAYTFNNVTLSVSGAKNTANATINGKLSIQGIATAGTTSPTYGASAILEYAGSAAQTASLIEFPAVMSADVIITNAAGVTLGAGKTLNGNLTLTAGTLAASTLLTMGTGPFTINRSEGSMTATTLGGIYNVNYTGNSKTTGPELLGGGLLNVTNNLTSGQTLTLDQNRAPDGDLMINSGTFDLSTFTFNRSASGGTLTVANGATLKIGGTGTLPSNYSTHSIGATSTVNYAGTAQTVSADSYGNLTLSGGSTKTLTSPVSVASNLVLTNSSIASLAFGGTYTAISFWVGSVPELVGTWGNTGSGATHIDATDFASTGKLYVGNTSGVFGQQSPQLVVSGSSVTVKYYGVPGYTYTIQRSINLSTWTDINTTTIVTSPFSYTDNTGPYASVYYRLKWVP